MQSPLYSDVTVKLTDEDGNSYTILGRVTKALRRTGTSQEEIDLFQNEATSGDYGHLLQTCAKWVTVE